MRIRVVVLSLLAANVALAATPENDVPYDVTWSIETGVGYETNAYHAPDHSYADYYADPTGATIVTPKEKAGLFVPLKFKTEFTNPLAKQIDLVLGYHFAGNFHLDSVLTDADDTKHQLNVGTSFKFGKKGKDGDAYVGAFLHTQDKIYVDRDSGDPKASTGGVDVSNRYTYTSTGFEGDYERKISPDDNVGVKLTYENLDYADPVAWTQYDHTYNMYGVYWEHYFPTDTKLTLEYASEVRDYKYRHAYDINGTLLASNPLLKYNYTGYAIGVRQRFNKDTVAYFDYEMTQRSDNNVGYNDLDLSKFKVRVLHDFNEKISMRVKVAVLDYNYANAYNFEDPTQGKKSASGLDLQLRGDYQWNKNKTYYVEFEHNKRDNTDDRYQYNNNAVMLGAKWKY
jgi:hypothetical protein